MKYLLTFFLLFFCNIGWCVKITAPTPVNLLKGVQATFTNWTTIPTASNLTDENWEISTDGKFFSTSDVNFIANIIFDLGNLYNNIIVSCKITYVFLDLGGAETIMFAYLDVSNDGITYTNDPDFIGQADQRFDGALLAFKGRPVNARFIRLRFNEGTPNGVEFTLKFYEISAFQYK